MAALKEFLEGKPLRSPLHPALVHLPIALFPIGVVLDVASWIFAGGDRDLAAGRVGSDGMHAANAAVATAGAGLVHGAFVCLLAGLAAGVLAAAVGFVDYADIRVDHPAKKTATRHMVFNLIALALFGVSAMLHATALRGGHAGKTPVPALIASLAGVAALSYAGYLGGHLVYGDGIAVGRHRRRGRIPTRTIAAAIPAGETGGGPGQMIAVADDTMLREGETLRVDLDGVIVAVARVDGGVFAFQEFCTHRYGPLTEGELRGCEVVCPWHNSRFDIRTGQVTHGPAKVPLRMFRAERRDGKIWIERPPESVTKHAQ